MLQEFGGTGRFEGFWQLGEIAYCRADDGVHGLELWRTDGTVAGTYMVKDINPIGSSTPVPISATSDRIYFFADDGVHGHELWITDGTANGTRIVKDIRPGALGQVASTYSALNEHGTMMGERLVFAACANPDAAYDADRELWISDGTEPGTSLLKEIHPGDIGAALGAFCAIGDVAFFGAQDPEHGRELWRTDGTEAGTHMIKDIWPGSASSDIGGIDEMGGDAYFIGRTGLNNWYLWRSDGTDAGTTTLTEMFSPINRKLVPMGDYFYFNRLVHELWISDGTPQGTRLVKATDWHCMGILPMVSVGGKLFFSLAPNPANQLWVSDGTTAGTRMLKVVTPSENDGMRFILDVDGTAFFSARGAEEDQLWLSDGTTDGTVPLLGVLPPSMTLRSLRALNLNGTILFDCAVYPTPGGSPTYQLWKLPVFPYPYKTAFNFRTEHSVTISFFGDVSASLSAGDLIVVNTDTNEPIDPAAMALSFDAATKTATFTFPGLPNGMLRDGNYRATLPADAVTDPQGNPLAQDEVLDFWYLAADPNRDGTVNLKDFNILAGNFGLTGRDFTQGDFNYDGLVDMEDFNLLAARFGTALPGGALTTTVAGARAPAVTRIIDQIEEPDTRDDTLVVTGA